ncbi:AMP-binding protein [Flagellimonas lutaonensis]|uniref:AMP-dependent synthetase and ligase n=1 Tax=Flagellimonas lutaonensis TaxID=516051 RepID=A0A0D5YV40_9FLAO|nr:AMP-binding protein [Allomuricauda lutaonensis]AKA36187.1 AMP-dependent synthetase and ligase [Allomuricauda lutaonensis]
MKRQTWHEVHPAFKLNGIPYTKEDLKEVGYSLVKEGVEHEQSIGDFLLDWLSESPIIEVNTSGSTGEPKTIRLKKEHMVNSALATGTYFGLEPGQTALHCLPSRFIAGKMMLVRAMVLGLEMDYLEPSSRPLLHTDKKYDFCAMVPLQATHSYEKLHLINTLIVGGAPITNKLKALLQDHPTKVYETYGMTETVTHIAVKKVNGPDKSDYFKTLPDVKISKDERGCLVIDAPKVADAPVVTNDVVALVSDTEFEWLGRFDNIINSGGVKLVPEQIEAKLANIFENRFFVAGIPDEELGQRLILVMEGDGDADQIRGAIEASKDLEKFEKPKEVYFIKAFLETDTQKILRKENLERLSL